MPGAITVFLADDNLLVRSGVRALLARHPDLDIVGEADDYDSLVSGAEAAHPDVVVTDIRMPPSFQREGIEAAKEVRKRHPGTGVVILSQFDDPEYAVALPLAEGSAGYGYLLKDRIAEGDELVEAIRAVATGGTAIDPSIVDALVRPMSADGLSAVDEELLQQVAEGRTIKAIAAVSGTPPEAVADAVERLFLRLAEGASSGTASALRRLRMLHQAIVDREEQGESLSRLLPGGVAEKLRLEGKHIGESEELEVTVLMSDIRGYSAIAEHTPPTNLASQLNEHRAAMNRAILGEGGTVMQFVGDAVMAVFGAPVPQPDHADRAMATAMAMHRDQAELNAHWVGSDREEFVLGVGLSTGPVAAALLGSEERLEYTLVGDTVNLSQRLQDLARPGWATVVSDATWRALTDPPVATSMGELPIKGREGVVTAWRVEACP